MMKYFLFVWIGLCSQLVAGSFTLIPQQQWIYGLHVDTDGMIYAGTYEHGVVRSQDGGQTFVNFGLNAFVPNLSADGLGNIYALNPSDRNVNSSLHRYSRARRTWEKLLENTNISMLRTSGNHIAVVSHNQLLTSENGGRRWRILPFSQGITDLFLTSEGMAYLATGSALYRIGPNDDEPVVFENAPVKIASLNVLPRRIYVTTKERVMVSRDDGATWEVVRAGVNLRFIKDSFGNSPYLEERSDNYQIRLYRIEYGEEILEWQWAGTLALTRESEMGQTRVAISPQGLVYASVGQQGIFRTSQSVRLEVQIQGTGRLEIKPSANLSFYQVTRNRTFEADLFERGDELELTAVPGEGFTFAGWGEGITSNTAQPLVGKIRLNGPRVVIPVNFVPR